MQESLAAFFDGQKAARYRSHLADIGASARCYRQSCGNALEQRTACQGYVDVMRQ